MYAMCYVFPHSQYVSFVYIEHTLAPPILFLVLQTSPSTPAQYNVERHVSDLRMSEMLKEPLIEIHTDRDGAPMDMSNREVSCTHSYTPLIHSSHTLLSYTPLIHSSHTLLSYTPLIHSSHTLLSYTPRIHSSRTLLSYTPLIHSSH
jgi:hypothetical protein